MLSNDAVPETEKTAGLQHHIDQGAQCALQRQWLAENLEDAAAREKYAREGITLLEHYKYFAFALERLDLATYRVLATQLIEGTPTKLQRIDDLYERSRNNGSDQASTELVNFADACNDLVSNARMLEWRAGKRVENR